jgi:hypothetical protein
MPAKGDMETKYETNEKIRNKRKIPNLSFVSFIFVCSVFFLFVSLS